MVLPASLYRDIYNGSKLLYLTGRQVRDMKDGDQTRFLCLDRNFWDLVYHGGGAHSPEVMFRDSYIVEFTKVGGMESIRGTFTWMHDNFEVDGDNIDDRPFDFSKDGYNWKPWIRQETRDDPDDWRSWIVKDVEHHDVEDQDFLGWRGPMIRWDTVRERFPWIENTFPND